MQKLELCLTCQNYSDMYSLVIKRQSKRIHSDTINKMTLISNIISIESFIRDLYGFQNLLNNETRNITQKYSLSNMESFLSLPKLPI